MIATHRKMHRAKQPRKQRSSQKPKDYCASGTIAVTSTYTPEYLHYDPTGTTLL